MSAAYVNATESNPIVGPIDMMVMVGLVRRASEEPWFAPLYGADATAMVGTAPARHEADIGGIGARYLTDRQLAELGNGIERWHREHVGTASC